MAMMAFRSRSFYDYLRQDFLGPLEHLDARNAAELGRQLMRLETIGQFLLLCYAVAYVRRNKRRDLFELKQTLLGVLHNHKYGRAFARPPGKYHRKMPEYLVVAQAR